MVRRRRKSKGRLTGRVLSALLAVPALYLVAALIGSLIPVNREWHEPAEGTTIYIADNGIHADIVMPVNAQGLDWAPFVPRSDFAAADPNDRWVAFGSGEQRVYLETPTWWDITPRTIWSALAGGKRVMHVEYVPSPAYAVREIRLRPEEYRRVWAAIRDRKLFLAAIPPTVLPVLATLGFMGLTHITVRIGTAMILAIALGLLWWLYRKPSVDRQPGMAQHERDTAEVS